MVAPGDRAPILMYHSISAAASPRFRRFAISPMDFELQMRRLSERGFSTLTVSQLRDSYDRDLALPAKPIVLTFDDGYLDFLHECVPVLTRYGFTATVYVVADCVGETAAWLSGIEESVRRLMTWSDLSTALAAGIEIGAHGRTHAALDSLDPRALKEEVRGSKRALEDRLQHAVSSFCYPYGFSSRGVMREVRDAGYRSACSVKFASASCSDDPYDMPRHIVRHGMSLDDFDRISDARVPFRMVAWDRVRSRAYAAAKRAAKSVLQ